MRTMSRSRYRARGAVVFRASAVILAGSLLAAACGSETPSDGDAAAEDTESPATPQDPAETEATQGAEDDEGPIRIGASLAQTGRLALTATHTLRSYQLWASHVNESGGLLGREVEFVVYDDRSDPATGARLYERLITQDEVDLITGPFSSAVTAAAAQVADTHGMVMMAPAAASDEIWEQGSNWTIGIASMGSEYLKGALEVAQNEGYETLAYLGEDTSFPQSVFEGIQRYSEEFGIEIVFEDHYQPGTTDFSSQLLQIREANPDVIIGGTYIDDAIAITRQISEVGVTPKMVAMTSGTVEPEYYENVGDAAVGVMGSTQWEPTVETPGNEEFVSAWEENYDEAPGYHAALPYASMNIMRDAIEACECLDQEEIRDYILDLETETIIGSFAVDPETGRQIGKTAFLIQWQEGGDRPVVWPEDAAVTPYQLPLSW